MWYINVYLSVYNLFTDVIKIQNNYNLFCLFYFIMYYYYYLSFLFSLYSYL